MPRLGELRADRCGLGVRAVLRPRGVGGLYALTGGVVAAGAGDPFVEPLTDGPSSPLTGRYPHEPSGLVAIQAFLGCPFVRARSPRGSGCGKFGVTPAPSFGATTSHSLPRRFRSSTTLLLL